MSDSIPALKEELVEEHALGFEMRGFDRADNTNLLDYIRVEVRLCVDGQWMHGTIAVPSSAADAFAFWNRLHERLAAGSAASDEPGRRQPSCLSGQRRREQEETMSREQSLRNGAGLMVLGAPIFLVYAVSSSTQPRKPGVD